MDEDAQKFFVRSESGFVDYLSSGGARYFSDVVKGRVRNDGGCSKVRAADAATTLFNRIGQYRVDVDELEQAEDEPLRELAAAYREYREQLDDSARCDFTVLQERFLNFLDSDAGSRFLNGDSRRDKPPLRSVLVDEYQDVNPLQQEVYFKMTVGMDEPDITVVGDDDQSLYRFRGATVDCLIEFPERAANRFGIGEDEIRTIQLNRNYRSKED
ncbi:MAG: UvrD-helicase domain-containing protein, partial [Halobacteria archaeon]|nr:UvrD-helicase domain-containing protein [Halobacteria archaeon]